MCLSYFSFMVRFKQLLCFYCTSTIGHVSGHKFKEYAVEFEAAEMGRWIPKFFIQFNGLVVPRC
jgi:hypothetical protein